MPPSSRDGANDSRMAGQLEGHLTAALKAGGWGLKRGNEQIEFWASRGSKRIHVLFRQARDARRSLIQALLADAVLRGRANAQGLVRFHGLHLDGVRAEPAKGSGHTARHPHARNPFSDLNQWLLKVLAGRSLSEELISIPRAPIRSAAELAARSGVSIPAGWRLYSALTNRS